MVASEKCEVSTNVIESRRRVYMTEGKVRQPKASSELDLFEAGIDFKKHTSQMDEELGSQNWIAFIGIRSGGRR